ncbi:MAG: hypothetical protein JSU59_08320, partial [Nitrospirota bacterium]
MKRSKSAGESSMKAVVSSSAIQVWIILVHVILVGYTAGCGTVPKRNALPEELSDRAVIPGIPKARFWGDEPPPWVEKWWSMSDEELQARYAGIYGKEHSYLALSGGGANGAFGAGLMLG